jgi:hypothetical protein
MPRLKYGRPEYPFPAFRSRWPIACAALYARTLAEARATGFAAPVDCVHVAHGELHERGLFMAVALLSMRHHASVRVVVPHPRLRGAVADLGACAGYCRVAPFLALLGMGVSAVEHAAAAPPPEPGLVWLGAPAASAGPSTVLVWGSALRRDVLRVPEWRLEDLGERLRPKGAGDAGDGAVAPGAAALSAYEVFARAHGCDGFERWPWARWDATTATPCDRPDARVALAPERAWTTHAAPGAAAVARCGAHAAVASPGADPLAAPLAAAAAAHGAARLDALRAAGALHAWLRANVRTLHARVAGWWAPAI